MSARDDAVAAELIELFQRVGRRMRDDFVTASADLGLNISQALIVNGLDDPVPMRVLAEWLSCEPSNVTGIVDGLEGLGLVVRRQDPADRRVKQVVLTPEGEKRRTLLRERVLARADEFFALPAAARVDLRDLLRGLTSATPGPANSQTC
ncbi:MarR family winged helix-turn-helix transcriptional regulator [Actinocorallia sp. A-T 12471]|uniref:MarR family winged helix-turn-helix transcriptional regulator n=1 Tax=Actinocorallia sp. A-T 12471 TaxID=3089813 RepID=UPI0029CAE7CC|nr:MarR family transcriptional regulator [Actinocorallia sp. A-T 12471]MDX6740158.1 MarR family transcriptional regulator [Actinocorallia sp. A-T 12471]